MAGIVRGSNGAVETNGVLGGVMGERGESSFMIYLSLLGLFRLMWGRSCKAQLRNCEVKDDRDHDRRYCASYHDEKLKRVR
jgi:hypothetical protein